LNLFNAYLNTYKIDIFAGRETFLDSSVTDKMISLNHKIFRSDRKSRSGGVAVGILNNIKYIRLSNFTSQTFESIFVEVFVNSFKLIIGSVYIPPTPQIIQLNEFFDLINNLIELFPDHKLIICGHFNTNLLSNEKIIVKELLNITNRLGLYQIINSFTYPTEAKYISNESLLDFVLISDKSIMSCYDIKDNISDTCDHFLIECQLNLIRKKSIKTSKTVFDYNEKDIKLFSQKLESIDCQLIIDKDSNVDNVYNSLIDRIISVRDSTFKLKIIKYKTDFILKNI
jgi:hypothetical protein